MANDIGREEMHEWHLHPVTRALMERFKADLERLKESWMSGTFGKDPLLDAKVRGQCEMISQFLSLESEDLDME